VPTPTPVPTPAPVATPTPVPTPVPAPPKPPPVTAAAPSAPMPVPVPIKTTPPAVPKVVAAATPHATPTSGKSGADRSRTALEIYRAGDLDGAAAIWESVLAEEHRAGFTVQLLTACERDTVRSAHKALGARELFLVVKKIGGRVCFRVCTGVYDSRDAAARALAELPQEYRAGGAAVRPVATVLER